MNQVRSLLSKKQPVDLISIPDFQNYIQGDSNWLQTSVFMLLTLVKTTYIKTLFLKLCS